MPRLRSLWLSLSDISRRIEQSEALHIAADFDGTLIPIVEHPDQAGVPERTRAVLHRLAELPELDLAILSDAVSTISSITSMAGGCSWPAPAGSRAGMKRAGARCTCRPTRGCRSRSVSRSMRGANRSRIVGRGQAVLVLAPLSRRPCRPAAGVRRRRAPARPAVPRPGAARARQARVRDHAGGAVGEVAALGLWLDSRAPHGTLFYFGDDTNDEPVHRAVRERGGIAVAVGRAVSAASTSCPRPPRWCGSWNGWNGEWSARAEARSGIPKQHLARDRGGLSAACSNTHRGRMRPGAFWPPVSLCPIVPPAPTNVTRTREPEMPLSIRPTSASSDSRCGPALLPVGLFLLSHSPRNARSIAGAEAFDGVAHAIWRASLLWAIEIVLIALPMLLHVGLGIMLGLSPQAAGDARGYPRPWMLLAQRASGFFLVVYVVFHVSATRLSLARPPGTLTCST